MKDSIKLIDENMSNRLLSLIIGLIMGLAIMYFASGDYRMLYKKIEVQKKYDSLKRKKDLEMDSLVRMVASIRKLRFQDSTHTAKILYINKKQIERYQKQIKEVSFKDYTDPELDSIVLWLYPQPR